jgi:hypothetical protein
MSDAVNPLEPSVAGDVSVLSFSYLGTGQAELTFFWVASELQRQKVAEFVWLAFYKDSDDGYTPPPFLLSESSTTCIAGTCSLTRG